MSLDAQIHSAGRTIRTLATRRQDARERGDAAGFAALDAEYKAALDGLAGLTAEQYRVRLAAKRRRDPMHGITNG